MPHRLSMNLCMMITIMLTAPGCTPSPIEPPAVKELPPPFLKHRVRTGETLSLLALWYTGDENKWEDLYVRASTSKSSDVREGDEVLVPSRMLVNNAAPSPEFVEKFRTRPVRKLLNQTTTTAKGFETAIPPTSTAESTTDTSAHRDFDPAKELMQEMLKNEKVK